MSRRLIQAERRERRQLSKFSATQGKVNPYNLEHYAQRSEIGPSRDKFINVKREVSWDGRFQVALSKDNNAVHRNNKEYFNKSRKPDEWSQARRVPDDLEADPQYLPGITFTP